MSITRFKYIFLTSATLCLLSGAPNGGSRQEGIFDPNLKLNAYNVTVPSNWKFDGVYVAGSSCQQIPFPVFRMYSADGLTEIRRFPRFDWNWSNSKFKAQQKPDCLNLQKELSAQEFLKYIVGVLQVSYVRDLPLPKQMIDDQQKQFEQLNAGSIKNAAQIDKLNASLPAMRNQPKQQPAVQSGGLAGAITEYRNGSFTIEQQIIVRTECIHAPFNFANEPGSFAETCAATVRVVRAPKGQLTGVLAMIDAQKIGAGENPQWIARYMQMQADQARARSDKMFRDNAALMAQRQKDFQRGQAIRAQQHQQFLATMQAGTDRSMANARAVANSNHAIAQDWCDYALDRQTVTGAGGTVKVSSAYNQTWTNGSGQYYQTNDPNANPNGVLSGNWTQTTQVHGDGSAKK
jgi:hypothetical protein